MGHLRHGKLGYKDIFVVMGSNIFSYILIMSEDIEG